MSKKLLLILVLFLFNLGYGQTNTWTGTTSTAWETGSNWSLGIAPIAIHDVVIPNVVNKPIISTLGATCATLNLTNALAADNTLTINSPGTLTVTGAITITASTLDTSNSIINVATGILSAGSITMSDSANDTRHCSLQIGTGTVTITGSITMSGSALRNDVTFSGAGTLNIENTMSGGTLTAGTGLVNYNSPLAQTIGKYVYNNLTLSGGGAKDPFGATVNGILSMEGDSTMSVSFPPTYGPAATLQYNSTFPQNVNSEWSNNVPTATFSSTGGVVITNTGIVTIGASGAVVKSLDTNIPLKINSGASLVVTGASVLNLSGDFINNGSFTSNGNIIIDGTAVSQNIGSLTVTGSGFVRLTKTTGTATLNGNVNAPILVANTAGATLNLGNGLTHTITGNWIQTNGTINGGSSTLRIGGNGSAGGTFIPGTLQVIKYTYQAE